ncbi:centrosomal protein of 89 kDa [Aricia agestis]|uniref:centrosomal protein of 89 kDa n=1 Tax=Aricia agestis TaxID=91739 RepID=UPI001C207217|nr:centrosomal protein of 89 kDa [Aricia agestis]
MAWHEHEPFQHFICSQSPQRSLKTKYNKKNNLTGNFTPSYKYFDIPSLDRESMRQSILDAVMKKTESRMVERDSDVNPLYEDPRDVIGDKPTKPPRKKNIQGIAVTSPRSKENRSKLKEQKRKLSKKYEGLVMALMEKCEENVIVISEKESHITKLRDKLKTVLEYNKLFSEENDRLKAEYTILAKYTEECKGVIKDERDRYFELEKKAKILEDKLKQYEIPSKEPSLVPLVEVCMNCSSRQIVLNQARENNLRLQKDMQAMKDVLYRLNVQLSRYQEKIRSNIQNITEGKVFKPMECNYDVDSLLTPNSRQHIDTDADKKSDPVHEQTEKFVDLSGLLSAQALAPLFDAYQENLQEKDNLILDYEKQFEEINKKSKQIVLENKTLVEKLGVVEDELAKLRQNYKKLAIEKETGDVERATSLERAEKAEAKLKEVYELYEDKISAMARDYETVHREYFNVKHALDASSGRLAAMDAIRARTVPADLHERRLDDCKRLLEELKQQYNLESERKTEQLKKLEGEYRAMEERYDKICQEHEAVKQELQAALKNVKLYRKAAVVFRQRARSATARATRARRTQRHHASEPLRKALYALERIKSEIKQVKSQAHISLEELERRILEQQRRAAHAQDEYRRELDRASLALDHKERIIQSLLDKVADVEEVRLSQANTSRLQGIVTASSSEKSTPTKTPENKTGKLVPGPGGYYKDKESRRKK